MSLLFPNLLTAEDGVYEPLPPSWLQWSLIGGIAASTAIIYSRGGAWLSFSVIAGLGIGFGLRSVLALRRHGPRGRPLVRVAGGMLAIRHAGANAQDIEVPLSQVRHLVVYGPAGHRIYRFVQPDGSWLEARPQWRAQAEALVISFLQGALGDRVVVEEPQNAFARARGDEPYFGN